MNTLQKTAGAILSLSLLCGMQVYAFPDYPSLRGQIIEQSDICQGVVKDANGESIIGASVLVKGTTNGSITGLDGDFSLRNVKKGDIIVVSYVGYQSQKIAWTGEPLNIVLKEDAEVLDEVVVIGYGAVRKADMAGSVAVLDNKNFKDQLITQVADALQGRVSGVHVENSGVPGGSVKIRIRGANSISKSNDPLYVVDGIVRESGLDGINPEDIRSMQVLKDASSTAIYGSRGSNGVVLITTKIGKAGVREIMFDASVGVSNVYKRYDILGAYDYALALKEVKGIDFSNEEMQSYQNGTGAHNDSLPRKVSYTLWSSEFIETEGATIAQILYMLGVEPLRDPFGRVTDLRLIPSEELGRPRIDVVVQTSGQLRDLAASRLFLITRAVEMASQAKDDKYPNYVSEGVVESEKHLVNKGVSPKEAREMSTARVFGGVDGNYGSGIQEMVEAGDRWDDESQIAETYIHNMGASYGSEKDWERMRDFAFEAALTRTDVVVQPRQSNTWGALSLDHVYEFMGGMNLAVRNVTGKDPDAYLADYRNRSHAKMQEVKEAIGVESRTTILNPTYIKEKMNGGAGDASGIADVVRNTYGWNVMKPDVIDNELWNDIYDTYIKDSHNLGTKDFFKNTNPAAIEEITAVMLETARKGMWKATDEQLATLAELHTEIVNEYQPSCSGFVCNNSKLRDYIASNVDKATADAYNNSISNIRAENADGDDGVVMKKDELNNIDKVTSRINSGVVLGIVAICALIVFLVIRRRRNLNK